VPPTNRPQYETVDDYPASVARTARNWENGFETEVASTAAGLCRCQLAAVKFTDGSSGQPKV